MPDSEVLVIGAGAAGLAALAELRGNGVPALCLEGRDRIGGRILTVHDSSEALPVELGAEFIHGRPPEIWNLVRSGGLGVYDVAEACVHVKEGTVVSDDEIWLAVEHLMKDMRLAAHRGPDQSFASFLEHSSHSERAKELSSSFV